MPNKRRLNISLKREEAMTVKRVAIGSQKLVYCLLAGRAHPYRYGRSRIVYIGTTKNGVSRIATSVAAKAEKILSAHGVQELHVRVITCKPRQRVKTWLKLERAALLTFRELYGQIPRYNSQGSHMTETDEFEYFSRARIRRVLEDRA